jgi:hypothetical protein
MVRPSSLVGTVTTLSRATAHSWSSPLPRPTRSSLDKPRMVLVMGATVTFVMAPRAASRVSTRAGRVLSRRTRQISRTSSVRQVDVRRRPPDDAVEVVVGALAAKGVRVALGQEPSHLALHRGRDERRATRRLTVSHRAVEEGDHLVGKANCDLGAHAASVPPCIPEWYAPRDVARLTSVVVSRWRPARVRRRSPRSHGCTRRSPCRPRPSAPARPSRRCPAPGRASRRCPPRRS